MIPANRVDRDLIATPTASAVAVPVGDELVLVDGWTSATVLNPAAATIWGSFDGTVSVGEVIAELTELTGAERSAVGAEVLGLARRVGALGLLEGVGPPDDLQMEVHVEEMRRFEEVGTSFPAFNALSLDDLATSSDTLAGSETLLVNWNPHCGYCVSLSHLLAHCEPSLNARGVQLVLLASGSPEANREMVRAAGFRSATVLRLAASELHPLPGIGTPAAYHLDADLRLASPPAFGNVDVPRLTAQLAGVELPTAPAGSVGEVRYLLDHGGLCAQGTGIEPVQRWVATRVYRIGDFHVGLRCGTEATVEVLDSLFHYDTVDDPSAGHTFVVSLPESRSDGGSVSAHTADPNLLLQGSNVFVRSRSAGRVLRALLWHLHDGIVGFNPACGRLRVNATAAVVPGGMVLLQPGLHVLAEKLQELLARRGVGLAEVLFPEIDLATCEVVLPEPAIPYDAAVVESLDSAVDPHFELPPVRPGRYPLIGWSVMHAADSAVTRFTPAEAAVATLSYVLNTEDAAARVRQLGTLFSRIPGFGLWYQSEEDYADALCEALGLN